MVIKDQKRAVERINQFVWRTTSIVACIIFILITMYFKVKFIYYVLLEATMIIFINTALIYAVFHIR